MSVPTALIADDEPVLARALQDSLGRLWPALNVVAVASNGSEALEMLDAHRPTIAFLDIRMPGLSGLSVARALGFPCHVVFVTAYDQYAVEAFEREAVDYLLKPVNDERLQQTVVRLQRFMAEGKPATDAATLLSRFQAQLERVAQADEPLRWIRASMGERIRVVPVEEVVFFQARDKYTSVFTKGEELLIRTPVRELTEKLDPQLFWQIHRGSIVNASCIKHVSREFGGRLVLTLQGRDEMLTVSRRYAPRFERM